MFHWESVCFTFSRCHISSASTGYKCWGGWRGWPRTWYTCTAAWTRAWTCC